MNKQFLVCLAASAMVSFAIGADNFRMFNTRVTGTADPVVLRAADNGDGTWTLITSGGSGSGSAASTIIATAQTALSTTAAQLVAADSTRKSILITNTDAAITIYLGPSGVSVANGFPLKPGTSFSTPTTAAIYAVAASGAPMVARFTEN